MDAQETQKKETIVKSMKKNFKDFRKRYGKDAKSVMYATATKLAMKEAVMKEIDPHNAAAGMKEDDGPHFTKLKDSDTPNFTTVAHPEDVVNQPTSKGNVDPYDKRAKRELGKRGMRKQETDGYGPEEFTGAVASIAKESVELQEIAVPVALASTFLGKKMKDTSKTLGKKAMKRAIAIKHGMKVLGKKIIDRGRGPMSETADPEPKGRARGHWLRRGGHIDSNDKETIELVRKRATENDRLNGVKQSPKTDARKYTRDGIRPYNTGPKMASSDKAGKRKDLRDRIKRLNNPPPKVDTNVPNNRMMDILNHPHYKKIAKQD